ncbi:Uncharacterised protein [Chlamydia trachomatis]|nr:Uncharacterised protein [Chlamydia trachomatis]
MAIGDIDLLVGDSSDIPIGFRSKSDHIGLSSLHLHDRSYSFSVYRAVSTIHNHGSPLSNKSNRPMLHFSCRVSICFYVSNFF